MSRRPCPVVINFCSNCSYQYRNEFSESFFRVYFAKSIADECHCISGLMNDVIRHEVNDLVQCDVEELSYEQIEEITGLPIGTVKSRIHRARAQLRAAVERELGEKVP